MLGGEQTAQSWLLGLGWLSDAHWPDLTSSSVPSTASSWTCLLLGKNGLPSPERAYVFNGDFVDRGKDSVEVLMVLFAFMLVYPKEFHLNRGNHEDYMVNLCLKWGTHTSWLVRPLCCIRLSKDQGSFCLVPLPSLGCHSHALICRAQEGLLPHLCSVHRAWWLHWSLWDQLNFSVMGPWLSSLQLRQGRGIQSTS